MPRGKKPAAGTAAKPTSEDKLKAEVKELKGALKEQGKLIAALDKRIAKLEAKGGKPAPAKKTPGSKPGRKAKIPEVKI
jgi:hypothetical protein